MTVTANLVGGPLAGQSRVLPSSQRVYEFDYGVSRGKYSRAGSAFRGEVSFYWNGWEVDEI